jgi:alpha-beta hydrolase superfamily lysophospholipase
MIMKSFTRSVLILAMVAALCSAAAVQAQLSQMSPEQAQAVWALQAQHAAGKLELSEEQTTQLVAAYQTARGSYNAAMGKAWQASRAKKGSGHQWWLKVSKAETEKFAGALDAFLSEESAKKAIERLGTFDRQWDAMVKGTAALNLEQKQADALEAISTYVQDRAALSKTKADGRRGYGALLVKLRNSLKTILSDAQIVQWDNAVARTASDNAKTVSDPRVQHRTYKFEDAGGIDIPYALFVPSTYTKDTASPLIVGLHGLGAPYDSLMSYGGILDFAERDGYIMVTPLGYVRGGWYGSRENGRTGELSEKDVMNVLEIIRKEFTIDKDRIYLWGHSMGGAGTYRLAETHPDIWAGLGLAAPAANVSPDVLEIFKHIPVIVLQGDSDRLVKTENTRKWVAKMKALGMEHIYIEVVGGDHAMFIARNPEILSKVFSFFNIVSRRSAQ